MKKKQQLEDFALEDALQEANEQQACELIECKDPTADNFLRDIPEEEDLDIKSVERYRDSEIELSQIQVPKPQDAIFESEELDISEQVNTRFKTVDQMIEELKIDENEQSKLD